MDLGFGGPVWHASVMSKDPNFVRLHAEWALEGVGDAQLGEWREQHSAFHIRRRLTLAEQQEYSINMCDMRNTAGGYSRLQGLFAQHPHLRQHARNIGESS